MTIKMAAGIGQRLIALIVLGFLTSDIESVGTLRLCGKELADALALVCQGRGYNVAFKPQGDHRGGRYKRGIVEECCRKVCALSALESYCSEAMPPKKDSLQISKRSEVSSKEIQSSTPLGQRQDERLFDNSVRGSKNRRLRPLVLLYSSRYRTDIPDEKMTNLNLNTVKSRKISSTNTNQEFNGITMTGYNSDNVPLDTSEIMAEVVESGPESNLKKSLFSKLSQV